MKKISLDVWIQLVGMISIVASLIFVGLEMRQSHQFALAAQQQARMEVFVDAVNTMKNGRMIQVGGRMISCQSCTISLADQVV